MTETFHKVCRADALRDEDTLAIEIEGVAMTLCRAAGRYYAVQRRCPHQGSDLTDGLVVGATILCGVHGWRFDLASGAHDSSPICLVTYPVRVAGDDVEVAAAPQARTRRDEDP